MVKPQSDFVMGMQALDNSNKYYHTERYNKQQGEMTIPAGPRRYRPGSTITGAALTGALSEPI